MDIHNETRLPRPNERGAIGALIIGVILGAILVIWLLIKLIGAIF